MKNEDLKILLDTLVQLPQETEWLEFKHNFHSPEEIGERISALSNSAALLGKPYAYLIFGVEDNTHKIIGTTFKAKSHKKGNEELEMWLTMRLNPRIDIETYEFDHSDNVHISLYRIPSAIGRPVTFLHKSYIRIGTLTTLLANYPDKEARLWNSGQAKSIENIPVKEGLTPQEIINLLSSETYFDRMSLPLPTTTVGIIDKFIAEKFVIPQEVGYAVTELGAIVLAKNLTDFDRLKRKSMRVIVYKDKSKLNTVRDKFFEQGYAVCFANMLDWTLAQLPEHEEIGIALRNNVKAYPDIAIRELAANMIIHQDFSTPGFPTVEIYSDRIEISNPGKPLISPDRFIDEYQSRNEALADVMRRMGFCEEKGSGLDKTIAATEDFQLPALKLNAQENRFTVTIFLHKTWGEMSKEERLQACYQHACLKYVLNEQMTNQSLRERFGIEQKNHAMVSRLLKEAQQHNLVKEGNPDASASNRKWTYYIPYWA